MKALVTGATGFVGTHLVQHLINAGDEVLGTYIPLPNLPPFEPVKGVKYSECDITDESATAEVIADFKPDAVYHLAAIAFVPEAEGNFDKALLVNVGGVYNIFKACQKLSNIPTVLFVSSAEVYGKSAENPVTEKTPLNPINNYSLSKAMAELVVKRFSQTGEVKGVIIRPFNHIGPKQNDRFVVSSFAKQLADIAGGKNEPVIKVGNLSALRDFSDVRDIVRAYRLAVLHGEGVFNLCSGHGVSIQSILDELIKISGLDVKVQQDPERMRPSDTPLLYGSYAKAEKELLWKPEIPLEQSLKDIYNDWLNS